MTYTESEYRERVYSILEKKYDFAVDGNETGWYDMFIEDCFKDNVQPSIVAKSIIVGSKST